MAVSVVAIVCDYYLPGFKAGGPVKSISAIIGLLGRSARVVVICRDRDAGDQLAYPDVVFDQPNVVSTGEVIYLSSKVKLFKILRSLKPDVMYVNSLFSPVCLIALLASLLLGRRVKRILAPRGELGLGALRIKPIRKRLALALFRVLGIHRLLTFHATSTAEAFDIQRELRAHTVIVVPNVPTDGSNVVVPRSKIRGVGRFLFLSRITRKKNLHLALEALGEVTDGTIQFDIYGPAEDENYWAECMRVIARLPGNVQTRYLGSVMPTEVPVVLSRYHALLMPTANENFGHAIVEALQNGVLPVISDQTPWRNLEAAGVGWDVSLTNLGSLVRAVRRVLDLEQAEFDRMSTRAARYVSESFELDALDHAYRRLFGLCPCAE